MGDEQWIANHTAACWQPTRSQALNDADRLAVPMAWRCRDGWRVISRAEHARRYGTRPAGLGAAGASAAQRPAC